MAGYVVGAYLENCCLIIGSLMMVHGYEFVTSGEVDEFQQWVRTCF